MTTSVCTEFSLLAKETFDWQTYFDSRNKHSSNCLNIALELVRSRMRELQSVEDELNKHLRNIPCEIGYRGTYTQPASSALRSTRGNVELIRIPAGRFLMGSPEQERGRYPDEGPQREVSVASFLIGRYAVTNEEYGSFLRENPDVPEPWSWGDRRLNAPRQPVVNVSWVEALKFAAWAGGRLPIEAEWEYAARAGSTARYLTGDSVTDLEANAWFAGNSGGRAHPVGGKPANGWGLHDVLGNVWEWVEDDWHGSYAGAPTDGRPWMDSPRGAFRVVRGGSWSSVPLFARVAIRNYVVPSLRSGGLGFRLAR